MATKHGIWTVVFDDKIVYKKSGEFTSANPGVYKIEDDSFWSQTKFSNIHAIQFTDDDTDNDQVEHKDSTPNSSYDSAVLGNFSDFISRWDSAHLAKLQSDWDNDNAVDADGNSTETEADKISRLGARPTSYSS
jgi:hypothetical protein|tara:strand:- start:1257 stop:1658 length:402 start_codon:yes stop_codon:yes gene_type:complete